MKPSMSTILATGLRWLSCVAAIALSGPAVAATADISNVPPATMSATTVRPNLMFILDDSGSMAWDYLPDSVGNNANLACYGYYGHNRVFFNPNFNYPLPSDGNGGKMSAASFTAAKSDGFVSGSSSLDLSVLANRLRYVRSSASDTCTGGTAGCSDSQSAVDSSGLQTVVDVSGSCRTGRSCTRTTYQVQYYYYTTLNAGATDNCSAANYSPVISLTTAEQKQNYANWYQYYRTRMLMMRSASGQVFDAIDPTRFRVGFSTISYTGTTDGTEFLNMADYDAGSGSTSQKAKFFSRLYGNAPSGSTPLRSALQKAGQYFAKKVTNQTVDPMQYSCQRNYTLLSTDGYWNTGNEPNNPSYIPTRLGTTTAIGDQDGVAGTPRPMYDRVQSKNSLADIAKYYYDTDVRTSALNNCTGSVAGQDVCTNKDPKPGDTSPLHQNMTTFTLGLGVPGVLSYRTDYASATTGDYSDIVNGTKDWPDPLSSTNGGYANTGGTVTARIDDLWHAAVNAGGYYYSAGNPSDLVIGLTDALNRINADTGASSAAATSTLRPVAGDDWVFLPSYETKTWVGDIGAYRFTIDGATGAVSISTGAVWNAYKTLAGQSSRRILFFDGSGTNNLKDFTYSNLSATQKAYFSNLCQSGAYKLSQCGTLTADALSKVTGENVVDFLRGDNKHEMFQNAPDDKVFRARQNAKGVWTPLGDVISSSPVYVRVPPFKYDDTGYKAFKSAQSNRQGMVYVGANDGMLHAFRVSDGQEMWAYVPSAVMSEMYRLADVRYGTAHRYYVDATPVVADVYYNNEWRTILVGGLGAGGRSYYALDVTDPTSPKALWEFADTHLGLTFGNPVVGKNKSGTWVVAFTSGYNNTAGDGNGRLYVLNAITGQAIGGLAPIQTYAKDAAGNSVAAGTVATPNNLGPINAWVENEWDNTIERIYGGDMLGNVWRFDFDDRVGASGREAFQLGTAMSPDDQPQPITVPPLVAGWKIDGTTLSTVVTVGTGRYLGSSDLGDTTVQSLYSFRDKLDTTALGNFRKDSGMVQQTMNASHVASATANVDWPARNGWYIDFDQSKGERVNIEMDLQLGLVTVATTVPTPTPCSPGGTSWLYYFDLKAGALLASEQSQVLIVGLGNLLENSGSDQPRMATVSVRNDGSFKRTATPFRPGGSTTTGTVKRTSWRELVN